MGGRGPNLEELLRSGTQVLRNPGHKDALRQRLMSRSASADLNLDDLEKVVGGAGQADDMNRFLSWPDEKQTEKR